MNSYPLIAAALDETEQQFIEFVELEFVERHARARDLPHETIRLRISTSIDDDCYRALHTLEVRGDGERVWRIEHSLKKSKGLQPSSVQFETRFALSGPGVPDGYGRRTDIEAVVDAALDAMRAGRTRGRAVSEQV
jgi:hypothetical protein